MAVNREPGDGRPARSIARGDPSRLLERLVPIRQYVKGSPGRRAADSDGVCRAAVLAGTPTVLTTVVALALTGSGVGVLVVQMATGSRRATSAIWHGAEPVLAGFRS